MIPSINKILSCIEANPVDDSERESLGFLQKLIKGLDTSQKLSNIFRFVSGSELMLFVAIQIQPLHSNTCKFSQGIRGRSSNRNQMFMCFEPLVPYYSIVNPFTPGSTVPNPKLIKFPKLPNG